MSVVYWLVDEAGCDLLGPQVGHKEYSGRLVAAAAKGPDGLARVLWLQERGVVLKDGMKGLLEDVGGDRGGKTVGQAQTLRYVMQRHSDDLSADWLAVLGWGLRTAAVACGSIPLVEELRQSGVTFGHQAYYDAGRIRDVEMTRWLVTEANVPFMQFHVSELIYSTCLRGTPARSQGLLQMVQLLVGAGAGADSGDVQRAMSCAAWEGNLPLVQFLAQHLEQQLGCQPDWHSVMQVAVEGGCEALLEWLAGKAGCLANAGVSYMPAAKTGDRGTLAALRRLGVPWGADFTAVWAVEEGWQAPVLRWLVEQGAPMGSEVELKQAVGAEAAAWLRGLAEAAEADKAAETGGVWRLTLSQVARVRLSAGAMR